MSRKIMRMLTYLVAALVVGVGIYFFYLWATYINEDTTSGQVYGLSIGDSKRQTYEKLPSAFNDLSPADPRIFMGIAVDGSSSSQLATEPGKHVMVQTRLDTVGFSPFSASDRWKFYVSGSYRDSLSLKFCNGKLCEIHRHRKRFELP